MAERARSRGFSLLEVLVAFSIMALVLGVLYQATGGGTRAAAHAERHAYAVLIAESLLGRFQSVPQAGLNETGRTADGFAWRISSRHFPRPVEAETHPLVRFHHVALEVEWENLGRSHSVVLETVLPEEHGPAPLR